MTEGRISKKIIFFAIPLFLGNLFQQLYNTADSLIVGNFLGSNALAAVSSSGNLIFLMVGFINGSNFNLYYSNSIANAGIKLVSDCCYYLHFVVREISLIR